MLRCHQIPQLLPTMVRNFVCIAVKGSRLYWNSGTHYFRSSAVLRFFHCRVSFRQKRLSLHKVGGGYFCLRRHNAVSQFLYRCICFPASLKRSLKMIISSIRLHEPYVFRINNDSSCEKSRQLDDQPLAFRSAHTEQMPRVAV